MKMAVLGAGGFVGTRVVEYLTLTGKAEVRGIVRRFSSLTRLSRFELDWRIADATSEDQLASAFEGCAVVLHCIMGDNAAIARSARPAFRAAERAGVDRIILISTAAVYGTDPRRDSDESTRPDGRGLDEYSKAKLRSEEEFCHLATRSKVGLVVLRPSLITGPRSMWTSLFAGDVLSDMVRLAGGGPGFCNTVYVDNLIEAVLLAGHARQALGEVFLIGDRGCATWRETYEKMAGVIGVPINIQSVPVVPYTRPGLREKLKSWREVPALKGASLMMPSFMKSPLRRRLGMTRDVPLSWSLPGEEPPGPLLRELAALHVCPWRLPSDKAQQLLGYNAGVSFDEALQRSVAWLRYAGLAPPN